MFKKINNYFKKKKVVLFENRIIFFSDRGLTTNPSPSDTASSSSNNAENYEVVVSLSEIRKETLENLNTASSEMIDGELAKILNNDETNREKEITKAKKQLENENVKTGEEKIAKKLLKIYGVNTSNNSIDELKKNNAEENSGEIYFENEKWKIEGINIEADNLTDLVNKAIDKIINLKDNSDDRERYFGCARISAALGGKKISKETELENNTLDKTKFKNEISDELKRLTPKIIARIILSGCDKESNVLDKMFFIKENNNIYAVSKKEGGDKFNKFKISFEKDKIKFKELENENMAGFCALILKNKAEEKTKDLVLKTNKEHPDKVSGKDIFAAFVKKDKNALLKTEFEEIGNVDYAKIAKELVDFGRFENKNEAISKVEEYLKKQVNIACNKIKENNKKYIGKISFTIDNDGNFKINVLDEFGDEVEGEKMGERKREKEIEAMMKDNPIFEILEFFGFGKFFANLYLSLQERGKDTTKDLSFLDKKFIQDIIKNADEKYFDKIKNEFKSSQKTEHNSFENIKSIVSTTEPKNFIIAAANDGEVIISSKIFATAIFLPSEFDDTARDEDVKIIKKDGTEITVKNLNLTKRRNFVLETGDKIKGKLGIYNGILKDKEDSGEHKKKMEEIKEKEKIERSKEIVIIGINKAHEKMKTMFDNDDESKKFLKYFDDEKNIFINEINSLKSGENFYTELSETINNFANKINSYPKAAQTKKNGKFDIFINKFMEFAGQIGISTSKKKNNKNGENLKKLFNKLLDSA